MKKVLLTAVLWVACTMSLCAQQSLAQFRQGVIDFLTEEGFRPTVDSSNYQILFKMEGNGYGVKIMGNNLPYTVYIYRYGAELKDYDRSRMLKACNKANGKKRAAKAMVGKTNVMFASELYCSSVNELTSVLLESARCANNIRKKVFEYYDENNF